MVWAGVLYLGFLSDLDGWGAGWEAVSGGGGGVTCLVLLGGLGD